MEDHLRVELDRGEHREAVRRSAPSTLIVYEAIRREGEHELQRPNAALAWSGLAAGLSMGFSFVAEALLHAHLPETPWRLSFTSINATGLTNYQILTKIFTSINATRSHPLLRLG